MTQPIDAATPLTVTFSAQEWNQILTLLGEVPAPYRITAPLINSIGQQMQQGASQQRGDAA